MARRWCLLNSLSGGRYTDSSWFNLLAGLYCYIHACGSSLTNPLSGLIYVMLFRLYTGDPFMKKTTLFVWLICRQKCPCFMCNSIRFVKFSICYSVWRLPPGNTTYLFLPPIHIHNSIIYVSVYPSTFILDLNSRRLNNTKRPFDIKLFVIYSVCSMR